MDDQELRSLIEKLHGEIQHTTAIDEKGRELLAHLEADIRDLLAEDATGRAGVQPSTLQRMQAGLDHFEVTHPALTFLLSKLLEALSNVGI